ncbi:hypothetical protein [Streptacidiphilus sp. EB103A]|jgi:hypothetical protein|uniref:hypothetical protein n=1 Tax=Streptacidiphilus sp. EB103A TaxID=3156275 RepID=UPI003512D0DC
MTSAVTLYGSIAAAVLATLAIASWLVKADRRLHRMTDVIERVARLLDPEDNSPGLAERLRSIENRTARIEAEHHTNGGSTTRDAINRLEVGLRHLNDRFPGSGTP